MLTAHLPAGYCLGKLSKAKGAPWYAALIGSILPDTDILFFYFVDQGAIHHHRYWVHIPFFWLIVAVLFLPLVWRTRHKATAIMFFIAIFLHLLLDSISGGIMWGAPYNDTLWALITVPASQSHWILSFLFHWTFLLELFVWLSAAALYWQSRKAGENNTHAT